MRITLIFTGSTKVPYIIEGTDDFISRLGHYVPLRVLYTRDMKASKKSTQDKIRTDEGKLILQHLKPNDYIILLDERGKKFSSSQFAKKLNSLEGRTGNLVFIVGGAYGFSEEIYAAANEKMALSDMTFSHQMVRMIFTEQLYRAYTILKGEPYHHS